MAHSQRQRLKHGRRKRSYGSMDDSKEQYLSPKSAHKSNNQRHKPGGQQNQKPTPRNNKQKTFCEWIRTDTFKKIKVTYFFISLFIPPIIAILYYILTSYDEIIYIIAGGYGILFNIYGFNHFRLLFNLRHEVDAYTRLNDQFKMERQEIDKEINKLSKAGDALDETHQHLHTNNLKMVDMIRKFESLEEQLNSINATSYDEISSISTKAHGLRTKYYDIALQQQRNILWKIFDRLEKSNQKGLTKEDYDTFYKLLPSEHKKRFSRLGGFETLLKVSDTQHKNYIDSQDFEKALDIYAQMHVENCDITFKIEKKKSNKPEDRASGKSPKFIRKVTIIKKKKTKGYYLTYRDILKAAGDGDGDGDVSRSPTPLNSDTEPILLHQAGINE